MDRTWGPTRWGGAFAPYKCFAFGKTLAQAELICAEHGNKPVVSKTKAPAKAGAFVLEQVKGIEPSYSAWEADVLPLNYTCIDLGIIAYQSVFGKNFFATAFRDFRGRP